MSLLNSVGTRPASWLAPSTAAAAHAARPAGRPEQEGWAATGQVTSTKIEFGSLGVVVIEGRDVGGSQELPHNLPPMLCLALISPRLWPTAGYLTQVSMMVQC